MTVTRMTVTRMKTTRMKMTTMQKYLSKFALLLALLTFPMSALALTLDEAKTSGLVGEQSDGYLGSVSSNTTAEVRAVLADINGKRKAKYEQIAKENNTELSTVEALAGKKLIEKTSTGNYVKVDGGPWMKK